MANKNQNLIPLIAGVVIIFCVSFFFYKTKDNLLELQAVLLMAIGVACISILLIGKATGNGNFYGMKYSVSGGFFVFMIVIILYTMFFRSSDNLNIENPDETKIWEPFTGELKEYNAPYGFASERKHAKIKYEWFKRSSDFTIEALLCMTNDSSINAGFFKPRLLNLQKFFKNLKSIDSSDNQSTHINFQKRIKVKVHLFEKIPTISFFTTSKSKFLKPYTIIYSDPEEAFRPTRCLTSFSLSLSTDLTQYFNNSFDDPTSFEISFDKLIDSKPDSIEKIHFFADLEKHLR